MEHLIRILTEAWGVAGAMAPYLLFGFLMAGVMHVMLSPEWVERHLGGKGLMPVLKAVLLGIPLPLCSCSVIPVTASIRRHGASAGATTGFLLATPQTGVDSLIATWGMMGPVFAIFRPMVALVTGLVGGGLVAALESGSDRSAAHGVGTNEGYNGSASLAAGDSRPPACGESDGACCGGATAGSRLVSALRYGFVTMPGDIGKELLIGIVIAALISALLPKGLFIEYLGGSFLSMLVMMAVGIPMYVCSTASIPIALGLMHLGASPGAALVFLVSGPATNAATVATVRKIMGSRTTAVYLLTVALGALAAGTTLDGIYGIVGTQSLDLRMAACHAEVLPLWQHAAAVFLLGLIAFDLWQRRAPAPPSTASTPADRQVLLQVSGMTCNHCAAAVDRALRRNPGVTAVAVDLASGQVSVEGAALDLAALIRTVEAAGFRAQA